MGADGESEPKNSPEEEGGGGGGRLKSLLVDAERGEAVRVGVE